MLGFKNIKFLNFQRYNLENHLNWFIKNSPNGHQNLFLKLIKKQKKTMRDICFQTIKLTL